MLKAVGIARVTYPADERFTEARPPIEVLDRLAAVLRNIGS
jgi:hypothetical protein